MKAYVMTLVASVVLLSGCSSFENPLEKAKSSETLREQGGKIISDKVSYDREISIARLESEFRSKCSVSISTAASSLNNKWFEMQGKRVDKNVSSSEGEVAQQMGFVMSDLINQSKPLPGTEFISATLGLCDQMSSYYKVQLARVDGKNARQAVRHATFQNLGGKLLQAASNVAKWGAAVVGATVLTGGSFSVTKPLPVVTP